MKLLTIEGALRTILDQVDYSVGNCQINEMVGAVLPIEVINLCKQSLNANTGKIAKTVEIEKIESVLSKYKITQSLGELTGVINPRFVAIDILEALSSKQESKDMTLKEIDDKCFPNADHSPKTKTVLCFEGEEHELKEIPKQEGKPELDGQEHCYGCRCEICNPQPQQKSKLCPECGGRTSRTNTHDKGGNLRSAFVCLDCGKVENE